MSKIIFTLATVIALFSATIAFAQHKMKLGDVSKEEISMSVYPKDSTADAVILNEYVYMTIGVDDDLNFALTKFSYIKCKILNKNGLRMADVSVYFGNDGDKVKVKGASYNLKNDKIVVTELDDKNIFTEKSTADYSEKKFALPNVAPGTVIEYIIEHKTQDFTVPPTRYFQRDIPVARSELKWEYPSQVLRFNNLFFGYQAPTKTDNVEFSRSYQYYGKASTNAFSDNISRDKYETTLTHTRWMWVLEDIPAIRKEPYMTAVRNYYSRIHFVLTEFKINQSPILHLSSWKNFSKHLNESKNFGDYLKLDTETAKIANRFKSIENPVEKLEAIRKYVNELIRFDGNYGIFSDRPLKKVLAAKTGSVSEINLFLTALAKEAGLAVCPAILSTRSRGKLLELVPQPDITNYVICILKKDNHDIPADATDINIPVGFLPTDCYNEKAWAVEGENGFWAQIKPERNNVSKSADIKINEDGTVDLTFKYGFGKYAAIYFTEEKEELLKEIKQRAGELFPDGKIEEIAPIKETKTESGYQVEYSVKTKTELPDIFYLSFLENSLMEKNPFELEKRNFPVEIPFLENSNVIINLSFPANFQVDELPKNEILRLGNGEGQFTVLCNQNGSSVSMVCKMQLQKNIFQPEEYQPLREFYSGIIKKCGEQIVLKKKGS